MTLGTSTESCTNSSLAARGPSKEDAAAKIKNEPWWFIHEFLGGDSVFDKQTQILEALRDYQEVYVPSCHASTKTWTAARALVWFLFAYPMDSIVVSTAPTWNQVEGNLWREVRSCLEGNRKVLGNSVNRILTTRLDLAPRWYAVGLSSDKGINLQGIHSPNILVILDEADGIAGEIWTAMDSILTSKNAKLLAIGNPLDPTSEFKKRTEVARAPKSKVIRITAEDVLLVADKYPFVLQREWVDDKRVKWGENSPLYIGKVLAQWPSQGKDTLIPISQLLRARGREVQRGVRTLGVDVARFGTNRTVRTLMEGNQLIWSKATQSEDTIQTASRVIEDIRQYEPAHVAVDETGVGAGVIDNLRRYLRPTFPLLAVNNGAVPRDRERFANLGSEHWWNVRIAFENDQIGFSMDDPEAVDELIADLNRPTYEYIKEARVRVDKFGLPHGKSVYGLSEEDRAAASPDRGDSFVLAYNASLPYIRSGGSPMNSMTYYFPFRPGVVNV